MLGHHCTLSNSYKDIYSLYISTVYVNNTVQLQSILLPVVRDVPTVVGTDQHPDKISTTLDKMITATDQH